MPMLRRNVLEVRERFDMEAGGHLDAMSLLYYTSDRDYTPGEKVVWICHALTGSADPSDWWSNMIGPGKMFDPDVYYVVCVSMLGSCYGLCSPATTNPATGKPYLLDFPRTTVRDIVNANILVRKALGIESIDLMLGPSIGGFQTVEWAVMEPDVIKKAVFLATAVRATPYLTAFNESQRMALLADHTFMEQKDIHGGREGLKCARSIALISYRTFDGYNATQQDPDPDTMFAERAASYQRYQGEKLVNRFFDAYSYWYLSYSLDSMNVGRGRGGVEKALESIKADCIVISITTDQIFPSKPWENLLPHIGKCEFHEITSIFGHDGFFIENGQLETILKPFIGR